MGGFELPKDPEVKTAWLIVVGAIVTLVVVGRSFKK